MPTCVCVYVCAYMCVCALVGMGVKMLICVCMYAYMCRSLTCVCASIPLFITHGLFKGWEIVTFSFS